MVILYQYDLMKSNKVDCDIEMIMKDNVEIENDFIKDMVYGVITYKDELDTIANKHMKDWDISRIDKTGAAILRLGIYELKYTDTPDIVVINEAVELSHKYSDESVTKMINACLDKIYHEEVLHGE